MRASEAWVSRKPVPRFLKGGCLVASTLIVLAAAPISRADNGPAHIPTTSGRDNTAADSANPPPLAGDKVAATKGDISRMITSYGNDIRDAYYRALRDYPKIDGEIVVSFTVRPGGDVADVRIETSSINWSPLEEDILNRIAAWKFPPFEGEPIPATVPYKFQAN